MQMLKKNVRHAILNVKIVMIHPVKIVMIHPVKIVMVQQPKIVHHVNLLGPHFYIILSVMKIVLLVHLQTQI